MIVTIEVIGVSKQFTTRGDGGARTVQALSEVSLTVYDKEFVSIIGPSGCGKTTLLKCIDGLVGVDSGEIRINGRRVEKPGEECAMVFQNFALLPWRNVLENIAFPLKVRGIPAVECRRRAAVLLSKVGLDGFENHYPHQLSGGMQQRVGLARALVTDAEVLLMDEPFGAVDAQTRQLLQEELLRLWEEERKTVLFITHSMEEAVFLSDRVIIMRPRPGMVAEALEVHLPRPRSYEFFEAAEGRQLTSYIWRRLKELMSA